MGNSTETTERLMAQIITLLIELRQSADLHAMQPEQREKHRKEWMQQIQEQLGERHFIPQQVGGTHVPGSGTITALLINADGVFVRRPNHPDLWIANPFLFFSKYVTDIRFEWALEGVIRAQVYPIPNKKHRIVVDEAKSSFVGDPYGKKLDLYGRTYFEFSDAAARNVFLEVLPTIGRLVILGEEDGEYYIDVEYHRRLGQHDFLIRRYADGGLTAIEDDVRAEFGDQLADTATYLSFSALATA